MAGVAQIGKGSQQTSKLNKSLLQITDSIRQTAFVSAEKIAPGFV